MSRKTLSVTVEFTKKETDRFLQAKGLDSLISQYIESTMLQEAFSKLNEEHLRMYPQTTTADFNYKNDGFYKNFEAFQTVFENYFKRVTLTKYFELTVKAPKKSAEQLLENLTDTMEELFMQSVYIAYNQVISDLLYFKIKIGQDPFDFS